MRRRAISKCSTSACARASRGGLVVPIGGFDLDLRRSIVERRAEQARSPLCRRPLPAGGDRLHRAHRGQPRPRPRRRRQPPRRRQPADRRADHRPLAERTLADLVRAREARRVRIEDILRIVSRHYKVPRNELLSSRRSRDVVRPRQIAMYLAKSLTSRSLPEIGRRFGGRDHTTVLHSVRKVEQMMKDDGDLTPGDRAAEAHARRVGKRPAPKAARCPCVSAA